jgi:hypothetical protein
MRTNFECQECERLKRRVSQIIFTVGYGLPHGCFRRGAFTDFVSHAAFEKVKLCSLI